MIRRTLVSIAATNIFLAAPALRAEGPAPEAPLDGAPPAAAALSVPATVSAGDAAKPSPAINKFKVTLFGFAELDMIRDSTQFLTESPGNGIVRGNTDVTKFAGTHERTMFSVKNSRVGLKL